MKLAEDLPGSPAVEQPEEVLAVITAERYPRLVAAMEGDGGAAVRAELARLLRGRFKVRAPRRAVARMARLQFLDEDEVVLLKDISTTGVRLLMESHPDTDLAAVSPITLRVNTDARHLMLPVAFVRLCGTEGKHLDVGFRFVDPGPQHEEVVRGLRNFLFNPR
jgi:hypothetical protein